MTSPVSNGPRLGALIDAGAHDAWLTPVVMKKGRPGTVVHALADPSQVVRLRAVFGETTGSLGVRVTAAERWPAARSVHSVWVDGQLIRVKVAAGKVKAEYEDVAQLRAGPARPYARWPSGPRPSGGRNRRGSRTSRLDGRTIPTTGEVRSRPDRPPRSGRTGPPRP